MDFARTLNAVAAELIPLLNSISANNDPQSQTDAAALTRTINQLITDAMQANALDVEGKLAGDAAAAQRLLDFTASADARAKQLAKSQANITKFTSLATDVGNVIIGAAGGNVITSGAALLKARGDLGIATA